MGRKHHHRSSKQRKRGGGARKIQRADSSPTKLSTQQISEAIQQGARYLNAGQIESARACFEQVLGAQPKDAIALNCMGIVHRLQGDHSRAIDLLRTALRLRPDFAEAHCTLGNTLRDVDRLEESASHYERAIQIKPSLFEAHNNWGVVHLNQGCPREAIARFEAALKINPQYAEAYNNLGNAYRECGELDDACEQYALALQRSPQSAEIHNNLANVFRDLGNREAALAHYEQALALQPELIEAIENLGTVLVDLGKHEAAIEAYVKAILLRPDSADVHVQLGNVYRQQGRLDEAVEEYQQAAAIEPENRLHALRVSTACPTVFADLPAVERYREQVHATWRASAEADLAPGLSLLTTRLVEPPFTLQFLDGNLRELKEAYAAIFERRFNQRELRPRKGKPQVGFVVTRTHEGIFLKSMRGVLEGLPRELAELSIICSQSSIAMLRDGIRRDISFLPLAESLEQMEATIREAAFDVLYYWEIGSDATNYFLPFLRLAPVQCTSWGIQVTSGIRNVDFYLSSRLVEPNGAQEHYSEKLLLADTLLSYQFRDSTPSHAVSRERFGLPDDHHVYLCPQQVGKFHPDFDPTLRQILLRDPKGILVVIEDRYGTASQILRSRMRLTMPDVCHKVRFLPRQDRAGYVNLIRAADVLLDPPHFAGVNTTYDAFTFGKPVVACPSDFHRGRYTLGCYQKMGIDDCLASDEEAYINVAVRLASDPERRRVVETRIHQASEVLFRDERAVREHERIFSELIEISREQR